MPQDVLRMQNHSSFRKERHATSGAPHQLLHRMFGQPRGIQRRLMGLVVTGCAAVVLITGAAVALQWRSLDDAAQIEARNLALSLAQTLSASTSHTLHFLPGSHGVDKRDIFVLDQGRLTLSSILPAEVGTVYVNDHSIEIDQVLRDGIPRNFTETSNQHPQGARFVAVPIRASAAPGAAIQGVLALEYSRLSDQLFSESTSCLYALSLFGMSILLAIAIRGIQLTHRLSDSLQNLQHGVESFARGRMDTRLVPAGTAEVAALGAAFNTMAEALQERTSELQREGEIARAAALEVERLAYTDPVTGLANRASLSRLLAHEIEAAADSERGFSLLMLGLDRFRKVNDSLGHSIGDELLSMIGQRLKTSAGTHQVVVRLGGDEFALLMIQVDPQVVGAIARKLIDVVGSPCRVRGNELRMSASIGVAIFPKDGGDEETLMRHADIALHHAKEEGGDTFTIYRDELNHHSVERLAFEAAMSQAIETESLAVDYQPKVSARTGLIEGVEALVRWRHPRLGNIPPMKFIPIAEETGLIVPLGRWVMKKACEQLAEWQRQGLPSISIAINLSPGQFRDPGLLADVGDVLALTGVAPHMLELEITESMLMKDAARTVEMLYDLKRLGIRLAVDDFGTGYSSLSQLRAFPVDTLKIDRSFVRGIAEDADDRAIAHAITRMARTLRLHVVAEGVETEAQQQVLSEIGCDLLQGFLFSPGVPAGELEDMLRCQAEGGAICSQSAASLTGLEIRFDPTMV